jgi:hypothetical protein
MAKPATTKKAAAPRRKAAAAKTDAAPRTAAASAETTVAKSSGPATATIRIDKVRHGGKVRGAVNGQRFELAVGSDVQVTEAQLNALRDSHVEFETITPLPTGSVGAAEGSAAPSTLEGTATRLEPATNVQLDGEGNVRPTPELQQTTDKDFLEGSQTANLEEAAKAAGEGSTAQDKAASGEAAGGKAEGTTA